MSYSFSAKGANATDAILDAEAKFDKVCLDMPVHGIDKNAVLDHMRNLVNVARTPQDGESIVITMNGYISVANPTAGPSGVYTVSAGCSVSVGKYPS